MESGIEDFLKIFSEGWVLLLGGRAGWMGTGRSMTIDGKNSDSSKTFPIRMSSSVVDVFKPCFYSQWFKLIVNGKVVFTTVGALGFEFCSRKHCLSFYC